MSLRLLRYDSGFPTCDSFIAVILGFVFAAELMGVETHTSSFLLLVLVYTRHKERMKDTSVSLQALPTNYDCDLAGAQEEETETIHPVVTLEDSLTNIETSTDSVDHIQSQKKVSGLFILQLRERRCLSQVAVDDVVQGCERIVEQTLQHAKASVKRMLTEAGIDVNIDDAFKQASPFTGLHTKYLQHQFFIKELGMIVSFTNRVT